MHRFYYASDTHGHRLDYFPEDSTTSTMLYAGDVVNSFTANGYNILYQLEAAANNFEKTFYVPGNHEYYDSSLLRLVDKLKPIIERQFGDTVVLLDNESVMHKDVLVIGSTMWSDCKENQWDIKHGMRDFRKIRTGSPEHPYARKITVEDLVSLHDESVEYIRNTLLDHEGPSIVMSHHAPSMKSVDSKYEGDPLNSAFCTDIYLDKWPEYWVHGHTHAAMKYEHNGCTVLCNPRGYVGEFTGFDQELNYFEV